MGEAFLTRRRKLGVIEYEVTADSSQRLLLTDEILAKDNIIIYPIWNNNIGNSYYISIVHLYEKKTLFGRRVDGDGDDPFTTNPTIDGNYVYFSTNMYSTRFGSGYPYKVIAY